MRSKSRLSLIGTFLVAVVAAGNAGCGGGSSTPPPPISVTLSALGAAIQFGTTTNFTAVVSNDSALKGVSWTLSCAVAQCGTVSSAASASGVQVTYTAPGTPPASDLVVTLTAASLSDPTKKASASITVQAITIATSPQSGTVQVGGSSGQFSAQVNNDPNNAGVSWTVSCSPGPCGSVSPTTTPSGTSTVYTAPATPPASNLTVTLTATSVTDPTKTSPAQITIPSVGLSLSPSTANVLEGASTPVTATVAGDPSNKGVTWAVSCATAPCGSVAPAATASGVAMTYTAPGPPASDLAVSVTATSVSNALAVAAASITVPAITVDTEPSSTNVVATTTQQFTATVGNDPANQGVTWTVSCSPAPCGSVAPTSTASGAATTYTAPALSPNNLTVTVTATSVTDPTKAGSATVTVPAITVSALSPVSGIIPINATQDFSATVNYDPTNGGVNWTLTQNGTNCAPACGTLSPASTASGTATTFTAPATVPVSPNLTITATSVADSSKSANGTITLTNGTVKLTPATLSFSCKYSPRKYCPPPTQDITLTDTGASALTINGIALGGANSNQFNETDDCGASVNSGSSCTITVKFNPTAVGNYKASVTFTDSSTDSPQQVALSGQAYTQRVEDEGAVRSDLATTTSAAVPAPTGSSIVGTQVMHLTDLTREDPYLNNGSKRELAVRLWYPTSSKTSQNCKPAAYTSPAVWNYFAELAGVKPFPVTTNSCQDAALADGVHPVVVFTPGFTTTFTDYTYLMEDLASRGYVVVAVAHTYESTAVELADGRLAKSVFGSHLGGTMQGDERSLSTAVYVRLQDLKFVVSELERLNNRSGNALSGKLDLSKIAVAGHSLGGLTAFLASQLDPRFKVAVLMDGFLPSPLPGTTNKAILMLTASRENPGPTECRLWSNLKGPRLAVNLRGTEHAALGDWIWLAKSGVEIGPMGAERTMEATREYIAAFLDANLRGVALQAAKERLLSGAVAEYPDAAVTPQEQRLCTQP